MRPPCRMTLVLAVTAARSGRPSGLRVGLRQGGGAHPAVAVPPRAPGLQTDTVQHAVAGEPGPRVLARAGVGAVAEVRAAELGRLRPGHRQIAAVDPGGDWCQVSGEV
jgi:hypothetical protein